VAIRRAADGTYATTSVPASSLARGEYYGTCRLCCWTLPLPGESLGGVLDQRYAQQRHPATCPTRKQKEQLSNLVSDIVNKLFIYLRYNSDGARNLNAL